MSLDQASKVRFPGSATGTNMHKPMGPFNVEARVTSLYSKDIFFIFSGQGEIGSVFRFCINYCFKKLKKSPVRIDVKIYHLQYLHVKIVLDFFTLFLYFLNIFNEKITF